jgi:hypothetical protein
LGIARRKSAKERRMGPSKDTGKLAAKQPLSSNIMRSMPLASTKKSSLLLVITAFLCSRTLLFFFHDPEGPNLLIVTVLALILYSASFIAWRFIPASASKKILFAICAQLLIVTGLYAVA